MSVWEGLTLYESLDMIHRSYQKKHGLEASTNKARQIVFNFTHGREYFRSAQQAQLYVKPLILYYGVLSLCRGLMLFLNHSALETGLEEGHGLNTIQWKEKLSSEGIKAIPKLQVGAVNGTFCEFCDATLNTEIVKT